MSPASALLTFATRGLPVRTRPGEVLSLGQKNQMGEVQFLVSRDRARMVIPRSTGPLSQEVL